MGTKITDVHVPLFIDVDAVINDLAHAPGPFSLSDGVEFASSRDRASLKQSQGCLWHALPDWFMTFGGRIEFEVGMRTRQLGDCTDPFWFSCYFAAFSKCIAMRFRSKS